MRIELSGVRAWDVPRRSAHCREAGWGLIPMAARSAAADNTTMPLQQRAEPVAGSADRRRLRVAPDRRAGEPTPTRRGALDQMLQLLERRRLSPTELRILLAVHDREITASELAETFGQRSLEIRRAAARLYARGLLQWRHDRGHEDATFAITQAGVMTVRPFLTEAATSAAT